MQREGKVSEKQRRITKWNAAPAVQIPEDDLSRFPEGTTHRIDQASAKEFSEREFIEALDYIGFFNQ